MIRLAKCEPKQLYMWHANLFSIIYMFVYYHFYLYALWFESGVFDPRQIVWYVCLDGYNYIHYDV